MKIKHLEKRYPNSLSGGERQRVALARALALARAASRQDLAEQGEYHNALRMIAGRYAQFQLSVAEIYHADVPFGYISRRGFREAPVMEAFAREKMRSLEVPGSALKDGSWAALIAGLPAIPPS